jgi:hypothetical protein
MCGEGKNANILHSLFLGLVTIPFSLLTASTPSCPFLPSQSSTTNTKPTRSYDEGDPDEIELTHTSLQKQLLKKIQCT